MVAFEKLRCWKINHVFVLSILAWRVSVTIQPIPPNHSSLFFTQQTLLPHRRSSKIPSATRDCWRMCVFHWKVSVTHGICLIICTGDLRHFLNNRRILMTEEQVRPIIRQVSWADVDGIRYLWCLSCGLKTGYFKWIRFFGNSYLCNHPLSQSFLSRRLLCSAISTARTSYTET